MSDLTLTEPIIRKCLETIDAGLSNGLGKPVPGQMCVEAAICFALDMPHGDDPGCVARSVRSLKIALNDITAWTSNATRAAGLRRLAIAQLGSLGVVDDVEFTKRVALVVVRTQVPIALRNAAKVHPDAEHKAKLEAAAVVCETVDAPGAESAAWSAAASAESAAWSAAASAAASAESAARSAAWSAASATKSAESAAKSAESAANSVAWSAANSVAWSAAIAAKSADAHLAAFAESIVQILIELKSPGCEWLWMTERAA